MDLRPVDLLRPRKLAELGRTEFFRKVVRYGAVSAVGVVVTQVALVILYKAIGIDAVWANVLAVCISAVPCYVLSRSWVWGQSGKNHLLKEVVPFWAFALAGLLISTVFVHWVHQHTDAVIWISAANLAGFGVLWVARFFVFDRLIWGTNPHASSEEDDREAEPVG